MGVFWDACFTLSPFAMSRDLAGGGCFDLGAGFGWCLLPIICEAPLSYANYLFTGAAIGRLHDCCHGAHERANQKLPFAAFW